MARKTSTVTITAEGRDKGKQFLLTEMPASQGERWANRVIFAAGRSILDVDFDRLPQGMAGLYYLGPAAISRIPWREAEELLAEMFACIRLVPDPARPEIVRDLLEDDIEEVATRWHLREGVISLHMGFSLADRLSSFLQVLSASRSTSSNTSTSTSPSDASSQAASQPSTS